jgi:hypothetical protein
MNNVEKIERRQLNNAQKLEGIDYATLEAHPLANLLPMTEGEQYEGIKADIARNGMNVKIKLSGILTDNTSGALRIIDGRNRYKMLKELGLSLSADRFEVMNFETYAAAEAYVMSENFHRRQLNNAQKREVIAALIAKYPKETNRSLSKICGINHVSIGNVRNELKNPKDRKEYDAHLEDFRKLLAMDDKWLAEFAREFEVELRELQDLAQSKAA